MPLKAYIYHSDQNFLLARYQTYSHPGKELYVCRPMSYWKKILFRGIKDPVLTSLYLNHHKIANRIVFYGSLVGLHSRKKHYKYQLLSCL